jgi:hypothetical protein
LSAKKVKNSLPGVEVRLAHSLEGEMAAAAVSALGKLESLDYDKAFQLAKSAIEKRAEFWDWDEDVELIGVAKLVVLPVRA